MQLGKGIVYLDKGEADRERKGEREGGREEGGGGIDRGKESVGDDSQTRSLKTKKTTQKLLTAVTHYLLEVCFEVDN
jgi:hypothetical protein